MPPTLSLHQLIGALTGAVTQAQDTIQKHQLSQIGDYFDRKGRPLCFSFMLPAVARSAEAHESRQVAVPLLSILEPNLLAITEFEVEFEVELAGLVDSAAATDPPPIPTAAAAAAPAPASDGQAVHPAPAAAERSAAPPQRTTGAPIDVPDIVGPQEAPEHKAAKERAAAGADPAALRDPAVLPDAAPPGSDQRPNPEFAATTHQGQPPTPMQVGLASRAAADGPLARLSVKVVGRPPSEGLVRLIDALNKTI